MRSIIENLRKPEYVFRPGQIVRRLQHARRPAPKGFVSVDLPWKLPLRVMVDETIGRSVWTLGVFELVVTEALWRLTDAGETVLDVGGNIGYMSSVLAARAGAKGRLMAFEPHPTLFEELEINMQRWRERGGMPQMTAHQMALSDTSGTGELTVNESFEGNRGLAGLDVALSDEGGRLVPVELKRLDEVVPAGAKIGVAKVDVEGHEEKVLRGAGELLSQRHIRDVVFEEHSAYPTPVTKLLEENGYTIFSLRHNLFGPVAVEPGAAGPQLREWDTQNFLGTADPDRVRRRFAPRGWASLRNAAPSVR